MIDRILGYSVAEWNTIAKMLNGIGVPKQKTLFDLKMRWDEISYGNPQTILLLASGYIRGYDTEPDYVPGLVKDMLMLNLHPEVVDDRD